jgi:hypothetical protein
MHARSFNRLLHYHLRTQKGKKEKKRLIKCSTTTLINKKLNVFLKKKTQTTTTEVLWSLVLLKRVLLTLNPKP